MKSLISIFKRKVRYQASFLALMLISVMLQSCGAPSETSSSASTGTEQVMGETNQDLEVVTVFFNFGDSARNSGRISSGSFADITSIRVDVEKVGDVGFVVDDQTVNFENLNSLSSFSATATLNGLAIGHEYKFIAKAYDNNSALIFKGENTHTIQTNSAGNSLSISLISQTQSEQLAIPYITGITKTNTLNYQDDTIISVVFRVDNLTVKPDITWNFWEYQKNPAIKCETDDDPANRKCGTFTPSSGNGNDFLQQVGDNSWEGRVETTYTPSGDENSIGLHKLKFEVQNHQRIGASHSFTLDVTGSSANALIGNFAPTTFSATAQRLVWDNAYMNHYVLEDESVSESRDLNTICPAPLYECLELTLEVADDGEWSNLSFSLNTDGLINPASAFFVGPSVTQTHFRSQGDDENKGVASWIIENYNDNTSGQIVVTVSDGEMETDFILDVSVGGYTVLNVGDNNLASTKLSSNTYYVENNEYYYLQIALNGEDTVVSLPYIPNSVSVWDQGGSVGGSFSIFNGNEYVFYNNVDGNGIWTGFDTDSIANIINQSSGSLTLKSVNGVDNSLRIIAEGKKPIIFNMNTKETSQIDNITLNYNQAIIKRPTEGSGGRDPGGNCTEFGMDGFSDQFSSHSQVSLLPDNVISGGEMDLLGFGGENSFYVCSDTPVGDYFVNFKALDGVGGLYSFTLEIQVLEEKIDGGELVLGIRGGSQ